MAGLKNYLTAVKCDLTSLLTVDLVCHGTAPKKYLQDHINRLEKKYSKKANTVYFRDPYTYTHTYTFTLRDFSNKVFYKKNVYRDDTYQVGYHSGIIYRENCYSCPYACRHRQGDLTLADFSGVGTVAPCNYDNKNVSCVLVNSQKGEVILKQLAKDERIYLEERPMQEEFKTEKQLRQPTQISNERLEFVRQYQKMHDFENSVAIAAKKRIQKNQLHYYSHIDDIKNVLRKIFPRDFIKFLHGGLKGK